MLPLRSSRQALLLASVFGALVLSTLTGCGDDGSEPGATGGTGTAEGDTGGTDGLATGGTSATDGTGATAGTGGGDNTGGTDGGTDGGTEVVRPTGTRAERSASFNGPSELLYASDLCVATGVAYEQAYTLAPGSIPSSGSKSIATSTLGASTITSEFIQFTGATELTWTAPAADPTNTPATARIAFVGDDEVCVSGVASLAQTIGGDEFYIFAGNAWDPADGSSCAGVTPSAPGLIHLCISTEESGYQ